MRDILDRQANTIEYVLHTHGINVHIDGGKLSARLAHFHMIVPPGVHPTRLAPFVPEIADALGVVSCRLAPGEDGLYLEVPRPDPAQVRLLPLVQRVADVVPPVTASLGLDSDGTPLLLRLNSPDVDPVLVCGDRGAGKSSLLTSMALSLALHNSPDRLRLLLLDCTEDAAAFRGMEDLPHLACPLARGQVDCVLGLRWAERMLARLSHSLGDGESAFDEDADEDAGDALFGPLPAGQHEQRTHPDLIIMIDGLDRLCLTGNRRAGSEALSILNRLLAGGGAHGIHITASVEQPGPVPGLNVAWGARIVGRVPSPEAARAATGMKSSGAHAMLGAGDFLVALNTELIRFQAACVYAAELTRAVDLIRSCALACAAVQGPPDRSESRTAGGAGMYTGAHTSAPPGTRTGPAPGAGSAGGVRLPIPLGRRRVGNRQYR